MAHNGASRAILGRVGALSALEAGSRDPILHRGQRAGVQHHMAFLWMPRCPGMAQLLLAPAATGLLYSARLGYEAHRLTRHWITASHMFWNEYSILPRVVWLAYYSTLH